MNIYSIEYIHNKEFRINSVSMNIKFIPAAIILLLLKVSRIKLLLMYA